MILQASLPVNKMSNRKDKKFSLKNASKSAREMIRKISGKSKKSDVFLSLIILSVGIALGIVFDEFILFLSIAIALDIVFYLITNDKN